jgi:hypothetical protein
MPSQPRPDDGLPRRRGSQRRQSARLAVAVALGLGLLSSCTSGGISRTPPPPVSAWQRVLDQIGPDGQVSKSTALAALLLHLGAPGVRLTSLVTAGPAGLAASSGPRPGTAQVPARRPGRSSRRRRGERPDTDHPS